MEETEVKMEYLKEAVHVVQDFERMYIRDVNLKEVIFSECLI